MKPMGAGESGLHGKIVALLPSCTRQLSFFHCCTVQDFELFLMSLHQAPPLLHSKTFVMLSMLLEVTLYH